MSETLLLNGECVETMRGFGDATVDAVVCDPPYHLTSIVERFGKPDAAPSKVPEGGTGAYARASRGFMGQTWDGGDVAFRVETWREVLRVLKPGGYLLAFSGTRTYHRMTVAIEDAGFEIRDCFSWQYGSGFPKSLSVEKNVPAEHAKRWVGFGTSLKPAWEPIVVARKPLEGTVAGNVLKYGTGAMNIDGCRVPTTDNLNGGAYAKNGSDRHDGTDSWRFKRDGGAGEFVPPAGRWPANVLLSCPPDCDGDTHAPGCPCAALDAQSGVRKSGVMTGMQRGFGLHGIYGEGGLTPATSYGDTGGASRFFNRLPIEADDLVPFIYAAKASRSEREEGCEEIPLRPPPAVEIKVGLDSPRAGAGRTADSVRNHHPCVKPVSVMRHLVRLVTPQGGLVLDPFMGSGTTGVAAVREGFDFVGIEMSAEYLAIAEARIAHAKAKG